MNPPCKVVVCTEFLLIFLLLRVPSFLPCLVFSMWVLVLSFGGDKKPSDLRSLILYCIYKHSRDFCLPRGGGREVFVFTFNSYSFNNYSRREKALRSMTVRLTDGAKYFKVNNNNTNSDNDNLEEEYTSSWNQIPVSVSYAEYGFTVCLPE